MIDVILTCALLYLYLYHYLSLAPPNYQPHDSSTVLCIQLISFYYFGTYVGINIQLIANHLALQEKNKKSNQYSIHQNKNNLLFMAHEPAGISYYLLPNSLDSNRDQILSLPINPLEHPTHFLLSNSVFMLVYSAFKTEKKEERKGIRSTR